MLLKMASTILVLFICGICAGNVVGHWDPRINGVSESKLDPAHPWRRHVLQNPAHRPFFPRRNENEFSATYTSTIPPVNSHFFSIEHLINNTFSAEATVIEKENITFHSKTENATLEEDGLIEKSKIVKANTDSEWVPTDTDETNEITHENISSSTADLKTPTLVPPEVEESSASLSNIITNVSVPDNTTLSVLKTNSETSPVDNVNSTPSKVNPSTVDETVSSIASTVSTTRASAQPSEDTSVSFETSSKIAEISDPTTSSTEEQKGSPSAESSTVTNGFSSTLSSTVTQSHSTSEEAKDPSNSSKSDELTTAEKTGSTSAHKESTTSTTSEELKSSTEKPGSTSEVPEDTTISISDKSTPKETTDGTKYSKSDELTTAEETGSTPIPKDNTVSTTSEELNSSTEKPGSTSEVPKDITVSESDESTSSVGKSSTIEVKTSSHSTNRPASEGVTDSTAETTTGGVGKHIPAIYNPTVTAVKLALSITFLAVAIVAMAALIAYMVKVRKRTIPYEELSLEP